jgi:predicted dienelactone hydrolase
VVTQRWNLTDSERNRQFYVDVYQPQQGLSQQNPVIIISHGLSSRPEDFAKRAEHLASYGYLVALPQHPGSDVQQTEDFLEGASRQIFQLNEFIDRPKDISYTLDELERRNSSEFGGKLDLDNVGAFGHSFGGYTVLAIAGATPNFERLEKMCAFELGKLNTALLLQCRALKLEQKDYNFRDERVKAIYAINPVTAGLFGTKELKKIKIPIFIAAGSYDPATPFVFEQTSTFPRLTESPYTYLQLQEGQAHVDFSELDAGISDMLETVASLTLPSPTLLDDYTNSLMLTFFEVHLSENQDYQPYLQPAYAIYLSEGQDFKTDLITKDSSAELEQVIEKFTAEKRIERIK